MIGTSVVDDTTVELPWSTKKEVANGHQDDITLQSVLICTNFEGYLDRMLNPYSAGVTYPLNLVGVRVLPLYQLKLAA